MQTNLAGTSKKDTHLLVCVFLFLYMSAYPKKQCLLLVGKCDSI